MNTLVSDIIDSRYPLAKHQVSKNPSKYESNPPLSILFHVLPTYQKSLGVIFYISKTNYMDIAEVLEDKYFHEKIE